MKKVSFIEGFTESLCERPNDYIGNHITARDVLTPPAINKTTFAKELRKAKKKERKLAARLERIGVSHEVKPMGRGVSLRDITNPSPITPKDNRVTPKRKYK